MSAAVNREAEIAGTFAEIARQLQRADSPEETWQQIAELAGKVLPAFEHAAVSLVRSDGRIDTPAASDDVGPTVDKIQYETNEGPCLSAIHDEDMYVTGDLQAEDRWPRFTARAVAETGIKSMLAFRLFADGETLGALNLYSTATDAFDRRAVTLGTALAAHAAVAMGAASEVQQVEGLGAALTHSREIGMALGLLMAQLNISGDQAFQRLSQASQRMNVKVRDLAVSLIAAHHQDLKPPVPST